MYDVKTLRAWLLTKHPAIYNELIAAECRHAEMAFLHKAHKEAGEQSLYKDSVGDPIGAMHAQKLSFILISLSIGLALLFNVKGTPQKP